MASVSGIPDSSDWKASDEMDLAPENFAWAKLLVSDSDAGAALCFDDLLLLVLRELQLSRPLLEELLAKLEGSSTCFGWLGSSRASMLNREGGA